MLTVNNLQTYYGESHILHDVSLKVKEGTVSALLGRNGMGKTTTIHSIMGLVTPKEGKLFLKAKNYSLNQAIRFQRLELD